MRTSFIFWLRQYWPGEYIYGVPPLQREVRVWQHHIRNYLCKKHDVHRILRWYTMFFVSGNCPYSFPACYGMRHSFCRIPSVIFRRSVWMSFFCSCPIPGGVASLALRKKRSSQSHIPFSRSFSCNRRLGKKKPAHKHVPTTRKRIDFSLCVFGITFM